MFNTFNSAFPFFTVHYVESEEEVEGGNILYFAGSLDKQNEAKLEMMACIVRSIYIHISTTHTYIFKYI